MQEMLYPTSYLKSMHLGKACALITDGRFSGGTSGLSIGHVSPGGRRRRRHRPGRGRRHHRDRHPGEDHQRQAHRAGDPRPNAGKEEEAKGQQAFRPTDRNRTISTALKAYALFAASADKGAVRILPEE